MIKKLIFYSNTHYYALGIILKKNLQNSTVINKKKLTVQNFLTNHFTIYFKSLQEDKSALRKRNCAVLSPACPKCSAVNGPCITQYQISYRQNKNNIRH